MIFMNRAAKAYFICYFIEAVNNTVCQDFYID